MATFVYEARTTAGELRKGTMDAESENVVLSRLRAQQLTATKVEKKGGFNISFKLPTIGTGVKTEDVMIFTRQFATMIDAGLPLVQCLDILGEQSPNRHFGKILLDIKATVEGGSQLSEAMRQHPKIFDSLFVNLVAAGEVGGVLDSVLNRLSVYLEKALKIKRQLKSAMTYPVTLLIVAICVIILMLWKVIPVFENMFKDFGGGSLPAITQFVIDLSKFVGSNIIFIAIIAIGLFVVIQAIMRSEKGRRAFDKALLKTPIFGPLVQKFGVARFTRTMGTLLTSGVPILDSLEICAKAAGNFTIQDALLYTRAKIAEGKSIAEPLMETRVFPAMVIQMIGVGESTGAMDTMLQKIADFYEDEVDVAVAGLMKMLEPVMFVFLGGICGGLMISMYVPIFELAGAIKAQ